MWKKTGAIEWSQPVGNACIPFESRHACMGLMSWEIYLFVNKNADPALRHLHRHPLLKLYSYDEYCGSVFFPSAASSNRHEDIYLFIWRIVYSFFYRSTFPSEGFCRFCWGQTGQAWPALSKSHIYMHNILYVPTCQIWYIYINSNVFHGTLFSCLGSSYRKIKHDDVGRVCLPFTCMASVIYGANIRARIFLPVAYYSIDPDKDWFSWNRIMFDIRFIFVNGIERQYNLQTFLAIDEEKVEKKISKTCWTKVISIHSFSNCLWHGNVLYETAK